MSENTILIYEVRPCLLARLRTGLIIAIKHEEHMDYAGV